MLYDQCLLINNRLEAYVTRNSNLDSCQRMLQWKLKEMQRTYQYAAETIEKVGTQSCIMALLKTEENAALITDTQYSLNQLVSVLALEHAIDVAGWQRKNSIAYKKDQDEIVKHYKRQEQDMTLLKQEVASYGSSIEQIQGILSRILQRLDTITTPTTTASPQVFDNLLPNDPRNRPRSFSSPSGSRPNMAALMQSQVQAQSQPESSREVTPNPPPSYPAPRRNNVNLDDPSRARRLSLTSRINIPTSHSSLQGPRSAIESSRYRHVHTPTTPTTTPISTTSTTSSAFSTAISTATLNSNPSPNSRRFSALTPLARGDQVCIPRNMDFARSRQPEMQRNREEVEESDVPETPPPAYSRTDPDPFASSFGRNSAGAGASITPTLISITTATPIPATGRPLRRQDSLESIHSVGVIEGGEYELPTPIIASENMNSRFDPDQLRDLDYEHTAQKVREALKKKDVTNFSIMKSVGCFGDINTRILVEMNELPRNRSFDEVIPLDCFEPNERDTLHLVKSRIERPGDVTHPAAINREFNHVLMLCPQDSKPNVIITKRKQAVPQQVIKAYIVNTDRSMTLVSIKESGKKSWVLIPFYPLMSIWEAKQYIESYFPNLKVEKCRLQDRTEDLEDSVTLSSVGVRAYDHDLHMTVSRL